MVISTSQVSLKSLSKICKFLAEINILAENLVSYARKVLVWTIEAILITQVK